MEHSGKKINVYVYGAGHLYNNIRPIMKTLNISVLGILITSPIYYSVDGYKVLNPKDADYSSIDYVIIAIYEWKEIYNNLLLVGCPREKIILGKALLNPDFVMGDYLRLLRNECSIISNNCIGGMISEELGIRYLSPTKNCVTGDNYGFCKIINDLSNYLNINMVEYTDWEPQYTADFYKRGIWGDCVFEFPHNDHVEDAIDAFNKRINLINVENIAVIMTLYCDDDVDIFNSIKCKKKLGIYYKKIEDKEIVYLKDWENPKEINRYHANWKDYAPRAMTNTFGHNSPVNWIKFLLGENDYMRIEYL